MFAGREVQLEHALLLHFAGQHADSLSELKAYKEQTCEITCDQMDVVLAKLTYLVSEDTW